ncbi:hypothetical protein [uncultured Cohaesibacter sp.]|uniref:hypothetical protein n=1 Tax=uncultured Cohaesibacter sp. TaxID=1002546 RepID=UPI0029C7581C|nr:hypothetical protein [uncultured Cohaesibacter sp.]
MNVILVGAAQSEQFIRAAAGGDDEGLVAKMSKVLRLFHDRHVGVPAAFARNVVQGFAASYPELSNPLRLAIYRRLLAAMDATASMKQDPRQFDHVARPLFYDLCLLPLCSMLTEQLQECYLFSLDPDLGGVAQEAYMAFTERFEALLFEVCEAPEQKASDGGGAEIPDQWGLFWERCAHQLWGELQRARHGRGGRSSQIVSRVFQDDVLLRMLYGLAPKPRFALDLGRDSFQMAEEQNDHLAHPKQGGVVGIHTSSRLEDIEDMLLSEMLLPPPLLADKLLNSSFFARHRPPPLDQKKQVMLIGASLDDGDDPVVALVKSCWLDAAFRMAIVLYHSDLMQSEIRFGQWRSQMGLVYSHMRVGDYKHLKSLDPLTASRMQLHRFFCDAGWLPAFLSLMPPLDGHHEAQAEAWGGAGARKDMQLHDILDALFPEARNWQGEALPDFSAILMVVIRRANIANAPLSHAKSRRQTPLECFNLTIGCPETLSGGETFLLDDGQKGGFDITIPGEPSQPVSLEGLNKVAADLVAAIFEFYWERVNG